MQKTPRRRLTAMLAIALAAATVGFAPATGAATADEPTYTTGTVTSGDAELATQLWRPAGLDEDTPTPVILHVTPYASENRLPSAASEGFLERALAQGWSVAVVSLRGYGGSTGCGDFFGEGERLDVVTAVEWANDAPWSNGQVAMHLRPGSPRQPDRPDEARSRRFEQGSGRRTANHPRDRIAGASWSPHERC